MPYLTFKTKQHFAARRPAVKPKCPPLAGRPSGRSTTAITASVVFEFQRCGEPLPSLSTPSGVRRTAHSELPMWPVPPPRTSPARTARRVSSAATASRASAGAGLSLPFFGDPRLMCMTGSRGRPGLLSAGRGVRSERNCAGRSWGLSPPLVCTARAEADNGSASRESYACPIPSASDPWADRLTAVSQTFPRGIGTASSIERPYV